MIIRILIADDHLVVRMGLAQMIRTRHGFEIVAEAENGEEALYLCQKHQPDIVLMDIRMRGMGGVAAIEAIRRYHPGIRVIGLSTFDDRTTIDQTLAAGASGFLSKTVKADELLDTIRRVLAGETVVHTLTDPAVKVSGMAASATDEGAALGAQQRRVLALLTKGYTNAEIAAYLTITLPTARYHVSAILQKLGVSNRAEAAAMAVRDGLIDVAGDF